ncbi:MAG: UDP-glucose/GDP-mannose dehydrogenase family protein [Myxococcota bacterium]
MRISIVGTGYVGLVSGACFADQGNEVWCVDIDPEKVAMLERGESPIYEPGLAEMVRRNLRAERLHVTTQIEDAVENTNILFVCVGTPQQEEGGADMRAVWAVVESIATHMTEHKVVVMKSTVPVGTAAEVRRRMAAITDVEFDVVSNPEFLREGAALKDFLEPDRVVIGTSDVRVATLMKELYAPFLGPDQPMLVMDNPSAELTKYGANALLATRISFMNELANLAGRVGADVNLVRKAMGYDHRIGHHFLYPGVGFGGSCFPKDVDALASTASQHGMDLKILAATNGVNKTQKRLLAEYIIARMGPDLSGLTIAIWGLAFKPNTDDMREAASINIIEMLLAAGAKIVAYDPEAMHTARKVFGDTITYAIRPYDALKGADVLAVVTEWSEFRKPNWDRVLAAMKGRVLFDGRNIFEPTAVEALGFEYYGIGRGRNVHRSQPEPTAQTAQDAQSD